MKKLKFALVAFIMLLMISAGAEASEFIFKYSDDAPQPAVFDFEAEYFDMNIYFTDDEEGIKRLSEKGYIEYYERNTEIYLPDEPEPDVSLMSMPNDSLVERQMEYEFNVTNAQGVVNNTIACGDQQIGARIAYNEIDLVLFFRDPLSAESYEPDVFSLLRL